MSLGVRNLGAQHLLNALDLHSREILKHIGAASGNTAQLNNLAGGFTAAAGGLNPYAVPQMVQSGFVPPSFAPPRPNCAHCRCPGRYAKSQQVDFGASNAPAGSPQAIQARQAGARLEQFLGSDPFARQQLEMTLGGRIIPDGLTDGIMRVRRFPSGGMIPNGGVPNGFMGQAINLLNNIGAGSSLAGGAAWGPGMFPAMMLGALQNTLGGFGFPVSGGAPQAGGFPVAGGAPNAGGFPVAGGAPAPQQKRWFSFNPYEQTPGVAAPGGFAAGGAPAAGGFPMAGGAPAAGGFPVAGGGADAGGFPVAGGAPAAGGFPNAGAAQQAGGFPVAGNNLLGGAGAGNALNDPSLTVEDKVVMLIMQIMKQFDKQIEGQANYVNQLQQKQQGQGQNGQNNGPSIDVESMKLKRFIDKRSQMFDMLRQLVDKYNQTAKGIIDAVAR